MNDIIKALERFSYINSVEMTYNLVNIAVGEYSRLKYELLYFVNKNIISILLIIYK